jgi:hypothetical protein
MNFPNVDLNEASSSHLGGDGDRSEASSTLSRPVIAKTASR